MAKAMHNSAGPVGYIPRDWTPTVTRVPDYVAVLPPAAELLVEVALPAGEARAVVHGLAMLVGTDLAGDQAAAMTAAGKKIQAALRKTEG